MIRAVNERDARVGHLKTLAEGQSAKACTDHDDMEFFVSSHAVIVTQSA